ncbi:MAG: UDP-glucose 6-dehydrogenase [Ignavibacteria bacterium GWA2_35_9]|nr:MAG: UDP-glucose 6-dehydrogenase [Ignavibacteria bacterium GWA2_35_9]OGU44688.1 MAG: UDP-glucose 6-dehydrogenase [Ignavibacteria bacterium GWB2_36_8]
MNIAVVGTGYVGLVTGTCFAETGNNVACVDVDEKKVDKLKNGIIPIFEPGLDLIFERNIKKKRLAFTTDLHEAVRKSEVVCLCLPTPQGGDGKADLSYILKVADNLGKFFKKEPNIGYKILVDKSTVPIGTSDKVREAVKKHAPDFDFDVASNPEFLREGMAVEDFMKPERVVIGTSNPKTKNILELLYEPFVRSGNPIYFMDERSAEMTKYAANSFLAAKISFMNEIANLCELTGADVDRVRIGMGADSRIGKRFLFPGVGYGGSCFPKDVMALWNTSNEYNYDFKILDSVIIVNKKQVELFYEKIKKHYKGKISGKHFAVWGLAFKPNTDDVREAPSHAIIGKMLADHATITAYDPEAIETTKAILGNKIKYAANAYDALENADALIIVTEWNEFRTPNFTRIKEMLKEPVIFDGRNLYDLDKMKDIKFNYYSVGREIIKN